MPRFFLHFGFNGSAYHGWQAQLNAHSVQAEVESVLKRRFAVEIPVTGAGRTDTGVHATSYFAHFDCPPGTTCPEALGEELSAMMPRDISLYGIYEVRADAHARFSATQRTYQYLISRRRDPFLAPWSWYHHRELDVASMNKACGLLLGEHDFSSFEKTGSDNMNSLCTVTIASWEERDGLIVFSVSANRFLRNMVRALVGTLVDVGTGKLPPADIRTLLEARDRSEAGTSAPAQGLFLTGVSYPDELFTREAPAGHVAVRILMA